MLSIALSLIILALSSQSTIKAYGSYDYGQTSTADEIKKLKSEIQSLKERTTSYTKINTDRISVGSPPMFTESYLSSINSDLTKKEAQLKELEGSEDVEKAQGSPEKYSYYNDMIWDTSKGETTGPPGLYAKDGWEWDSENKNYYHKNHPSGKRRTVDTQVKIIRGEV